MIFYFLKGYTYFAIMNLCDMLVVSILLLCGFLWTGVSGLTLPHQATMKPRLTRPTTPEPSSSSIIPAFTNVPSKDNSGIALYRLINSNTQQTCILLKTDAVVEVNFRLHNLPEQADSFIPDKALVDGNCKEEDTASLRLSWSGYNLLLNFAKTPGGERWYISYVELTVNVDQPVYHGIKTIGNSLKLYHKRMLIPTPVGKSYSCDEVNIKLEPDKDDHPPPGINGSLLLRLLEVQPFMYKSENFETAFECKGQKMFRDETAPIAVGSTLAIAVLLTVAGYGAFRYYKIKNVQYNTME